MVDEEDAMIGIEVDVVFLDVTEESALIPCEKLCGKRYLGLGMLAC